MTHFAITDLNFLESLSPMTSIVGSGRITPRISTAAATGADTRLTTSASVSGDLKTGFKLNVYATGSAAAAQASAASIGGTATASVFVRA